MFLSHAEIHRFAVRTGWLSLSVLSFYRLLQLLENFALFEERTGDIVKLLKFVFEDSEDMQNLENMLRDAFFLQRGFTIMPGQAPETASVLSAVRG